MVADHAAAPLACAFIAFSWWAVNWIFTGAPEAPADELAGQPVHFWVTLGATMFMAFVWLAALVAVEFFPRNLRMDPDIAKLEAARHAVGALLCIGAVVPLILAATSGNRPRWAWVSFAALALIGGEPAGGILLLFTALCALPSRDR